MALSCQVSPQKDTCEGFQFFFHNVLQHCQYHISKNWRPILPWYISGLSQCVQFNIHVSIHVHYTYMYETFQKMLLKIDQRTLHFRLRLAIFSYLLNRSLSSSFSCRATSNSFLKSKKKKLNSNKFIHMILDHFSYQNYCLF